MGHLTEGDDSPTRQTSQSRHAIPGRQARSVKQSALDQHEDLPSYLLIAQLLEILRSQ